MIEDYVEFFKMLEALKYQTRTAWLSDGTQESVAEHTWRMTFMAMCLMDDQPGLDAAKVLKMCLVHDLGEACEGDVSAKLASIAADKHAKEAACITSLTAQLDTPLKEMILKLWAEYDAGETEEAKFVKGIDKLETIIQHNQGVNPENFDYAFNLEYGKTWTSKVPCIDNLRSLIDDETRRRMKAAAVNRS